MNKEKVLAQLEELGFALEEAGEYGYFFKFEGLNVLYMPDDDDENFLRFAVPNIYDVTEENKDLVLEVVNNTNMAIKYSKTCVVGDDVWIWRTSLSTVCACFRQPSSCSIGRLRAMTVCQVRMTTTMTTMMNQRRMQHEQEL